MTEERKLVQKHSRVSLESDYKFEDNDEVVNLF